ncbi:MAG: hypothetical protein KGI38_02425 [Thaumarchaeota archaeon]|nr:hypothetical protein [Nitrososphaerota archaeon]
MGRVSKLPVKSFQHSMKRAAALARLDGYLEDLASGRVDKLLGGFAELPNEIMKIIGIDAILMEEMNEMIKRVKVRAEPLIANLDQEQLKKRVQDKILPDVKRLTQVFEDLGLVAGRTLPEQSLILGVSAFEIYLKDITSEMVAKNPRIEKRFSKEIKSGFNLSRLEAYRDDARRTKGEIAADAIKLEPNRIRLILRRLFDWDGIFVSRDIERKFVRIVATRNLIIHRAGLVDSKYKRLTDYNGRVGHLIVVTRRYSLESLSCLSDLVKLAELRLHPKQRPVPFKALGV